MNRRALFKKLFGGIAVLMLPKPTWTPQVGADTRAQLVAVRGNIANFADIYKWQGPQPFTQADLDKMLRMALGMDAEEFLKRYERTR